jgi:hypothetical protein
MNSRIQLKQKPCVRYIVWMGATMVHPACPCPVATHLGEEEAGDPVAGRGAVGDPALDEAGALQQVSHPGGQGLEAGVSLRGPQLRDLRGGRTPHAVTRRCSRAAVQQGVPWSAAYVPLMWPRLASQLSAMGGAGLRALQPEHHHMCSCSHHSDGLRGGG